MQQHKAAPPPKIMRLLAATLVDTTIALSDLDELKPMRLTPQYKL
jgi:hypothetical protein